MVCHTQPICIFLSSFIINLWSTKLRFRMIQDPIEVIFQVACFWNAFYFLDFIVKGRVDENSNMFSIFSFIYLANLKAHSCIDHWPSCFLSMCKWSCDLQINLYSNGSKSIMIGFKLEAGCKLNLFSPWSFETWLLESCLTKAVLILLSF